jgi:hypothetical protein
VEGKGRQEEGEDPVKVVYTCTGGEVDNVLGEVLSLGFGCEETDELDEFLRRWAGQVKVL